MIFPLLPERGTNLEPSLYFYCKGEEMKRVDFMKSIQQF